MTHTIHTCTHKKCTHTKYTSSAASGQHYLMQFNGIAWLTKALTPPAPAAAVAMPSAWHPAMGGVSSARPSARTARTARSARPNVTLDEACTSAHTYTGAYWGSIETHAACAAVGVPCTYAMHSHTQNTITKYVLAIICASC